MVFLKREIKIDGKLYNVEVDECPTVSPFSIKINDKTLRIAFDHEPNFAEGFSIRVSGKSYQVELPNLERDAPFSIKINNISFKAELKPVAQRIAVATMSPVPVLVQKPTKALAEGVIAAPMAGKIISIRVKKGDSVKVGNVLCILEAMKMQNEITSTKSGVVEEVNVQEGKAVDEGEILILIK